MPPRSLDLAARRPPPMAPAHLRNRLQNLFGRTNAGEQARRARRQPLQHRLNYLLPLGWRLPSA